MEIVHAALNKKGLAKGVEPDMEHNLRSPISSASSALTQRSFHAPAFAFSFWIVLAILALMPGMAAQTAQLTATDKADMAYVHKRMGSRNSAPLDLSDPIQKRFLLRQLQLAGVTPQQNPQLFRSIRNAHPAKKTKALAAEGTAPSGPQPLSLITDLKTSDQKSFVADALSSVPGGTTVTVLTLQVEDQNGNPVGTPEVVKSYAAGQNVRISASGQMQTAAPAQAVGTYFYEKDGVPYAGNLQVLTQGVPTSINNLAPTNKISNPPATINLCVNRFGSASGCDYACTSSPPFNCNQTANPGNPPNIIFPVQGNIVYPGNIDPIQYDGQGNPTNAYSRITVAFNQVGGTCSQTESTNFFKDPNTKVQGNTLSWNLNPAQFGVACYQPGGAATYAFSVYVTVGGQIIWAFINNTGTTPAQNTVTISPTNVVIGCIAEGTRILLENGKELPIENFDGGEKITADAAKRILPVTGTMFGKESEPMVEIHTQGGRSLLLTVGHPVVTSRGVVVAHRLKVGDEVTTLTGRDRIVSVSRKPFSGSVWNLDVGAAGDATLNNENTTFFANGILVGDSKMQTYWETEDRRDRRTVLERLPKRWQQDYLNWLKDHPEAQKQE
jgi:hypothetical protein